MLCSRTRNAHFKIFSYAKDRSYGCQKPHAKINSTRLFSNWRRLASRTRPSAPVVSYDSPAGILAKRRTPTLLYRSGSNLPYILGCYFIGGGLIGCGIINNHTKNLAAVADVPAFVPIATAIGVIGLVAVGSWMCLRPQNMVHKITSIPSKGPKSQSIVLEIERSQSLPFIKPKPTTVKPSDVTISAPIFLGGDAQINIQLKELRYEKDRRYAFSRGNLLSWPFRLAGFGIGSLFLGVKKAFGNSGIIHLHVKGRNISWKMERDRAWALEDGRWIDNLVKIKDV